MIIIATKYDIENHVDQEREYHAILILQISEKHRGYLRVIKDTHKVATNISDEKEPLVHDSEALSIINSAIKVLRERPKESAT